MTTTFERAARAMEDRLYQMEQDEDGPDCYRRLGRSEYAELTRAVLMAVRDNAPTRAMAGSQARGDEGVFLPLLDLLDFSGENARDMVLRAAWCAAIDAILNEGPAK